MIKLKEIFGIIIFTLFVTGCASPIKGSGPYKPDDTKLRPGQRYYVCKDILLISADVNEKVVPVIEDDLSINSNTYTTSTVNTSKKLVPDYSQYYMLQVESGGVYDDRITISSTPDGILTSLSSDVTGKSGEVLKGIGTIASNLLALAPVLAVAGFSAEEKLCVDTAKSIGLNKEHQLFSKDSKEGCEILKRISVLKGLKSQIQSSIDKIWSEVASTNNEVKLKNAKVILDIKKNELSQVVSELVNLNKSYDAQFLVFKEKVLSEKNKTLFLTQTYEITELPLDSEVINLIGKNESEVLSFLEGNYLKMKDLFVTSKILISRAILSPLCEANFKSYAPNFPKSDEMPTDRIYFRQSHPFHIGEYKMHVIGKEKPPVLMKSSSKLISLTHPSSPIQYLEYNPSSFSKKKLELTFDPDSGVLTKIVTDSGSSAEGVVSAISGSVKSMQTEYLSTLGNVESAQGKLNKIRLNDIQKNIDKFKKKKELVDAQVEFEGVTATQELLIEQKILFEKLNTLNSELALAKAESTYEQDLGLAKVSADLNLLSKQLEYAKKEITYEQQLEIEKLKTEIMLLKEKVNLSQQGK